MEKKLSQSNIVSRPPVVVIMGHVDHGKSTLLDYIRKTNIVAGEAGGITQHISAYEVIHKDENKNDRAITFLDTPGHEAFSKMRCRGAQAADIAILIVSAEDSVKAQTIEAYNTIIESKIPYLVAINKIDKPNADIEKTKMDLVTKGIYLEGMGGDIPFVLISAKTGKGIDELLDMILLVADMNEFTGDKDKKASGVIIEAHREPKRGVSATCLILDGTLTSGMFVTSGNAIATTRIMENFLGKPIKKARFSSPIILSGFDNMPEVGGRFESFDTKKEAEGYREEFCSNNNPACSEKLQNECCGKLIPLIIKTDVAGTIEAIEKEIEKLNTDEISFKIINKGVGAISESDIKMAGSDKESVIVGFNVKIDPSARDLNETMGVNVQLFNIIYKLTDWLKEIITERKPKCEVQEVVGSIKILRVFNATKDKQVVGGKITMGRISDGNIVRIVRKGEEVGYGKIVELQQNKIKMKEILAETECGAMIESKTEIATGDVVEAFITSIK